MAQDESLISRLEALFEASADPARAADMARYMRCAFVFYGIPAPGVQAIGRKATSGLPRPSESDLRLVARACWRRAEREWQYFACGYLRRNIAEASPAFITTAEMLITTKSWWDTVDTLAAHTVGTLVRAHPELASEMDRWIEAKNLWLARSALLHQLSYKEATDADRLFSYCLRRAKEDEFFIRKAIGWALRGYSKTNPRAVREFVRANARELSGLSQREALKWLSRR